MKNANYSAEGGRLSGKSGLPYSRKFQEAVDSWLEQIRKIAKVIHGDTDIQLLARIDQSIEKATQQLFDQMGRQDIVIDNRMTSLAESARYYVEILCPEEQGRRELMDTLRSYWSTVLLTGICAGKPASVDQSCYVMCQFRYRVFFAVMKDGEAPSPY